MSHHYVRHTAWMSMLLGCLLAPAAWAQPPLPPGSPVIPGAEQPRRAPITITPTISVTGEYNDNIFLNNANKQSDFIIGFTPGISVALENPIYRLLGTYSFTAEVYTDHENLNDALARQNLRLDGSYRVTPRLTVALSEVLDISKNTNAVATENVATGRTKATSNTLSPGVAYQLDPRTTLRARAGWTALRYDQANAIDSDVYSAETFVDYAYTPRLTLTTGYQFAYFDVDQSPTVTTHTPRFGATYRFTPTITGIVNGGPTIEVTEGGSTRVTPAVTAAFQERFSWGAFSLQYDRAVGTAGGLGGTTDNQSLGAVLQIDRLVRDLTVQLVPRYTTASSSDNRVDVEGVSLTLQGRYQITRWMAGIAGYTFFHQTSNSTVVTSAGAVAATDVDQNRVFVGLQFGYPISID